MTADPGRRFTDREVALVLEKAAEIEEEGEATGGARGLSLVDLEQIAREVGISPAAVARAVASMDRGPERSGLLEAQPATRKAARAVPTELDRESLGRLMRQVDEEADYSGVVSEALGSVRWTGGDRFHSMTVSLTPERGETTIQVVEKSNRRVRRIMHLLPTAWATILAGGAVSTLGLEAAGAGIALVAGAAVGMGVGRAVWNALSKRSAKRVDDLSGRLWGRAMEGRDAEGDPED